MTFLKTIVTATVLTLSLTTSAAFAGGATSTIADTVVSSPDFSTLATAAQAANLVETLSSNGPLTVFAPTNEAFDALPSGTVETLLKPENKAVLTKILMCHAVAALVLSEDVLNLVEEYEDEAPIGTVGGCDFTAMLQDGNVVIKDGQGNLATVTAVDLQQSNGVIHVLDKVLMPAN